MNTAPINDGIEAVMSFCRSNRSAYTTKYYQKACDLIALEYDRYSMTCYDSGFHEGLIEVSRQRILDPNAKFVWFERYLFRVLSMIRDYCSGIQFQQKYHLERYYKHKLEPQYELWAAEFRSSLKQKPLTIPVINSIARDFFHYLQELKIKDFSELKPDTFYGFLIEEYKDHSGCMGNVSYVTRLIMSFMREQGYSNIPTELLPFVLPPSRKKVLPALSADDADSIFDAIDLNTIAGKRDYAILLLAYYTGLRSIDIANLLLTDINWSDLTVKIVQHKTSVGLALPLDAGVAAAIADYILHARPDTESKYVFMTLSKPYRKLCDKSSIANVFNKYVKLSGIDKVPYDGKTFHAIRRSMGVRLLESGANAELISQILGHQDKNVLKRYLPIEQNSLIICALDFSGIPLKSEVYS